MSSPTFELKNEIVRAGAGAGKTTALTTRVLDVARHFFAKEERSPRIVVTTFTRKATEELRERLIRKACEEGESRLIDFVTTKSYLHISTIHGVLAVFLRRMGHWLNIDTGFSVIDAQVAERLSRLALRELLLSQPTYASLLEEYNVNQLTAMVRQFMPSDASHCTEDELRTACLKQINVVAQQVQQMAGAIESEAQNDKWLEYARHLRMCASQAQKYVEDLPYWLEQLESLAKPRYVTKSAPISEGLHDELKLLLKKCEALASPEYDLKNCKAYADKSVIFSKLHKDFSALYQQKKLKGGYLEFDDLEYLTHKAVQEHPELVRAFSADWDYWLVDEFQDTSPRQVELLRALVGTKPIYVVGDPQQSIYLFRGARSRVFQEKEDEILSHGGTRSELMKNYRSRPELLLFFNDFFKSLSKEFSPMLPKSDAVDPAALVARYCVVNKDCETPYAVFAQQVLDGVQNSGGKFDDYCVLARTNHELYEIAQYFDVLNLPTHIHASDGFYQRREILDILSFLKFLLNPFDNKNLVRLLRSPWLRVADQDLVRVASANGVGLWTHLKKECAQHPVVQKLSAVLESLPEQGVFETVRQFVLDSGLLQTSHFHDATGRRESNIWKLLHLLRDHERQPGFNYYSFLQKTFASIEGLTSADEGESDAVAALEPNRVNFMTVHKAKGLKFKHVLLPNMGRRLSTAEGKKHERRLVYFEDDNKFTLALRMGEERKMTHNLFAQRFFTELAVAEREEQLRVLYVALTRAEQSVTMQWKEAPDRTSWAAQLNADLSLGVHPCANYTYEVINEMAAPAPYQMDRATTKAVREPWQAELSTVDTSLSQRVSVTRLLDDEAARSVPEVKSAMTQAGPLAPMLRTPAVGAMSATKLQKHIEAPVFGQRLHSFFESLKYRGLSQGRLDEVWLNEYCEKWFSKGGAEFQQAVRYVLNLSEPPIQELILRGEVEWGFQFKVKDQIIEGQIDLWGIVDNRIWIVDYKSGSAHDSERAFAQLSYYAQAVRARKSSLPIELAIIYAIEEKVLKHSFVDV